MAPTNMFSRSLIDEGILFDFLQPVEGIEREEDLVSYHKKKYRSIISSVVKNPELGYIAGGFFIGKRPQPVDLYVQYGVLASNPPLDDELNALLTDSANASKTPLELSDFIDVLKQCECTIDLPNFGGKFTVNIRFTWQNHAVDILQLIDYKPARISYSYVCDKLYFDDWFLTGGPRYARNYPYEDAYKDQLPKDEFDKLKAGIVKIREKLNALNREDGFTDEVNSRIFDTNRH